MTQASSMRPQFFLQGVRRDEQGAFAPVDITETKIIESRLIRLREVPYFSAGSPRNVIIRGFTEVFTEPTAQGTFRVNYGTGRVTFAPQDEQKQVTIDYKGIGSLVATDEINYLYTMYLQSKEFTGLADTTDTLFANAFLRVDPTGKRVITDSANIGRATSVMAQHDFVASPVCTLPGTPFDIITVYKSVPPTASTQTVKMSADGEGTVVGTTWEAGAAQATCTISALETSELSFLTRINAQYARGDGLRFVVLINGAYYTVGDTKFEFISNSKPADILAAGSDVSELEAIKDTHMREYPGRILHFLFVGGPGAELELLWEVSGAYGGGWEQVVTSATYNVTTNTWSITGATSSECLVTMGSGHSDIACTADVVKFPDVGPNQTVKVNAPVQTLLNVLYTKDTTGLNPPAPWPPNWASFVPSTRVVRLYGDYYGGVCPALLGSDISPSPASIANINTAAIKNSVVGGYTLVSKGTTRPVQGRNGPGILFEHTASNKPTLELKAAAHNYGKPPTVYNTAIAGLFKYLSGAPIIMSSSHPEASSSALRRMYVQYINATTLRLYLCKRSWGTQVETYADYTVPDGWNYIALERVAVIGSLDVSAVASLRINDTVHKLTGHFARWGQSDSAYGLWVPNCIGNAISSAVNPAGAFIVDTPAAWAQALAPAEGESAYTVINDRRSLLAGTDTFTKFAADTPMFAADVRAMQDVTLTDPLRVQILDESVRFYFASGYRVFVFDMYENFVEVPVTDLPVLFNRGMKYTQLVAHVNTPSDRALIEKMTLCAVTSRASGYAPGLGVEFKAYTGDARNLILAKPGTDVNVTYNYATKSWLIQSLLDKQAEIHVAVLGGAAYNTVAPVAAADLIDFPNISGSGTRTLVAQDGVVRTAPYIHPFMLVQ